MDEKGLPFCKIWHIAIFDPRSNRGHYGRWLINYVGHKIIEQHVASSWKDSEPVRIDNLNLKYINLFITKAMKL